MVFFKAKGLSRACCSRNRCLVSGVRSGLEQPVALRGADGQELLSDLGCQRAVFRFAAWDPFGQGRLEEFGAEGITGPPEGLERRQPHGRIIAGFRTGPPLGRPLQGTV